MTSLVKAAKAEAKGRVLVMTARVRQVNAHAPMGNGLRISPAMVVTNMAKSCQACLDTWVGLGTANLMSIPIEIEIASGISFAPGQRGGGGGR